MHDKQPREMSDAELVYEFVNTPEERYDDDRTTALVAELERRQVDV